MVNSYMYILAMSICSKIYKSYLRNEGKSTLVHALNCQKPTAMVASVEPTKFCAHIQATEQFDYSLVCQAHACAVPMMRYRDHDHEQQLVNGSLVRCRERDGNCDRTADLTTSVDAT